VRQETFISYKGYRWLLFTIGALIVCAVVYIVNSPVGGRNGGTVVGYSFGTLATMGIIWLMAYGIRKRSYRSSLGTVEGWLAAHIWIGIGLLFLVPLHSGFSFGCNVHTLAYLLMILTIVSGIWGVLYYATLSDKISSHRGGRKEAIVLEQISSLSAEIDQIAKGKSDVFMRLVEEFNFSFKPRFFQLLRRSRLTSLDQKRAGEFLVNLPEAEKDDAMRAIGLMDQKIDIAQALVEDSRIKNLLRVWLFIHVPASIALCVALAIHIFSVFFFW
jgi:hypothetical protein